MKENDKKGNRGCSNKVIYKISRGKKEAEKI